jgi:hypothetical protein
MPVALRSLLILRFALVAAGPAGAATTRQNVYLAVAATTATPTATPIPATPARLPRALAAGGAVIRVPADVATLQSAINQVPNGGIIELAAGTYTPPANAFGINDTGRAFTIRAATGATVAIDGGGTRDLLRFINSSVGAGRPVVFERIIFRNGVSTIEGIAGGVTVQRAQATFRSCTFESNRGNSPSTGGGGVEIAVGSTAFFFDCTWTGNSAKNYGAGLALEENSTAYIHNGTFVNNRTNMPGHTPTSGGAGIHNGNSVLRVTNSRFENNQAGYVGGGIYAIGTWTNPVSTPRADVLVVNTTFINNRSVRDPSVGFVAPTDGGGVHVEDQATARIIGSRFLFNSADTGGGANSYRAILDISDSVFEGNRATGTGGGTGFGGGVSVISADGVDASTANGTINRRPSQLTIRDTLFHGRAGSVTTLGQSGGCIFAGGDGARAYGFNGVPIMGPISANRAPVLLERVALVDCDVQLVAGQGGTGGGLMTAMADLTMQDSLVIDSDALGATGAGGGVAIIDQSLATITSTLITHNTSATYGGGIFAQASILAISGVALTDNEVSPGVAEATQNSYGAAIFTTISDSLNQAMTGTVSNSVISNNVGVAIFDDDRTNGPINDVRYNGNQIFGNTFTQTYTDTVSGCCRTTAQLNSTVVNRANGTSTDKVQTDNVALGSAPVVGKLLAVPSKIFAVNAVGDSAPPTAAYLAAAWGGASATLDGSAVGGTTEFIPAAGTGSHVLAVGSSQFSDSVGFGAAPVATFAANPTNIHSGQTSALSWTTTAGAFLTGAIDQGVGAIGAANGSTNVSPTTATTYSFIDVTDTGGWPGTATVMVNGAEPTINSFTTNSALVNPGSPANLAWSTAGATSANVNGGSVAVNGSQNFSPSVTTTYTLNANNSFGTASAGVKVNVNAGSASLGVPTISEPSPGQVVSVNSVNFVWSQVAGAAGYDRRVWNAGNGATVFQGSLSGAAATSALITLPPGSFLFGVRACGNGFGDAQCGRYASRAFSINPVTPTGAPAVTAPAAGAVLTTSTLSLRWTAVAGSGTFPVFYEVQLLNQPSGVPELQILLPDPTLSTVARLHSGSFTLRVRACQIGCGPWSGSIAFSANIGPAPSSAPSITSAVVSGGTNLAVSWSAVAGAEWYQMFVIQSGTGPGGGALTVAAREVVGTSVSGVALPVGNASVLVAACTGNGCGPFSGARSITATGQNPSAPQIGQPLSGSVVDGPGVMFTWNRVPGDNGSNTTYRLYVQDLSRGTAALDVLTTNNFYAAYFRAEGARYDALVVANPGPSQVVGPAVGFNVRGQSATAPTMTQPTHNSTVPAGNIQLAWSPVPGATLYEYFVSGGGASTRGVTPGLTVQVPLASVGGAPTAYTGIVRSCPAAATCAPGSDAGWGPWSDVAGPGVTNFTVTP